MAYTDKKAGAVGAVCVQQAFEGRERELLFEEILLDETLAQGDLWVRTDAWSESGGLNHLLGEKKNYELLLRVAKKYRVVLVSDVEQGIQTLLKTEQSTQVSGIEESTQVSGIEESTQVSGIGESTQVSGIEESTQVSGIGESTQVSGIEESTRVSGIEESTQISGIEPSISETDQNIRALEEAQSIQSLEIEQRIQTSGNKQIMQAVNRQNMQAAVGGEIPCAGSGLEQFGFRRIGQEMYGREAEPYGWKTDCYLISRYKTELLAAGCFDDAVKGVLLAGGGQAESYLEGMLSRNEEYFKIYDYTQPILIYAGDEICYHVLDTFARSLGKALQEHGCSVIYFDMTIQPIDEISTFVGKRLKAVIGMQTYLFSAKKKDGSFIHDAIGAAEYYFVFDHPVWLRHHLTNVPKQMTVLTPDGNYAAFIEKYYGHPARFLPPAGQEQYYGQQNRVYGISFLGTYRDSLLDELKELRKNDKKKAYFISRFILYMRRDIAGTPERALEQLLDHYHMPYTREEFEQQFFSVRWTILRIAHYYRRKVIETLLQAGLTVHVFGDSWKDCPLCAYEGLVCHDQAVGEQALQVYGSSKLSLNIMTWHKDGFTERIANAMLQKSVVVTDCTTYLEQNFINEKELILFRLDKIKELPQKIQCLLEDDRQREKIAECGYQKAKKEHTWHKRAGQLLELMDKAGIGKYK